MGHAAERAGDLRGALFAFGAAAAARRSAGHRLSVFSAGPVPILAKGAMTALDAGDAYCVDSKTSPLPPSMWGSADGATSSGAEPGNGSTNGAAARRASSCTSTGFFSVFSNKLKKRRLLANLLL